MNAASMFSVSRERVCATFVFAFLLVLPMRAGAQSSVSVTANPTSVAPGATVTLNATSTPAGYDCGYGCVVIGTQGYLQISGSNGYYTSTTDPDGNGGLTLPGSDTGPGQTLQPVTYTASGGFHYDLCYYEPGWEFYGCVYGYGSYDESGSAYASVGPAVTPTALSVSPSSGGGPRRTFVFQYSSPAGEGDIAQTWQILHQSGQTSQSCVVGFYRPGTFVLWDDAGPGNDQYAAPNTPVVIENSQCRLHMANTTVEGVGNNFTVVIDVSFKSGYFGNKAVVAYGYSNGGGYGTPIVTYWTARPQLNTPPDPVLQSQPMTLTGVEFGTSGTVKFNACDETGGLTGTVLSWLSTTIQVEVPAGAVTGPVCVFVNGQASNTASLTVQTGPVITDVSPRWGPASTPSTPNPITLHGVNFGTAAGVVKWDGVIVGFTNWGDDHVTLNVPQGATSGHLTVVRNGVSSNGVAFEVGDEGKEYYHTDGIGSVRMITGYDGDVLERHDYLPFGEEWPPRPDPSHVGFGGKERDQETGTGSSLALNYFGSRSYHSSSGRFTTPDLYTDSSLHQNDDSRAKAIRAMVRSPQNWNRYSYVGNNPLRFIDVAGQCRVDVRFKSLGPGYYHAYIVTTDKDTQTFFRGGPSKEGPSGGSSGALSSGGSGGATQAAGSDSQKSNSSNSSSPGSGAGGTEKTAGPFGAIVTDFGPYKPGTIDWDSGTPPAMTVLDDGNTCGEVNGKLAKAMDDMHHKHTLYNPFTQNSNSTVREALERAGINTPRPPVWAPAWDRQLP